MSPSAILEPQVVVNGEGEPVENAVPATNGAVKEVKTNAAVSSATEYHYPPTVSEGSEYTVLNQYHSKPTKLRVACIGAGASGLCLAYKMERMLAPGSWELTLFDKNSQFGGTWYENTYPGVACDVRPPLYDAYAFYRSLMSTDPRFPRLCIHLPGIRSQTGLTISPTVMRSRSTLKTLQRDMGPSNT